MSAPGAAGETVRDAAVAVLRAHGLTTVFANPGSTEVAFLADLPDDLRFVLALHEGSVVGMATGWAIARGRAALVQLHTTAGLGNAVGARATARVNRAPLVVLVGQQDRRPLALEPFLTGHLRGLAGEYPVWTCEPAVPQEVPGAIARARFEAEHGRGPAIVVVPQGDWSAPAGGADHPDAAPARVVRSATAEAADVEPLAALLADASAPALVTGAGTDSEEGWEALRALAERIGAPVFQESFGARAGFPQDHPLYAGVLPADRAGLRGRLDGCDAVLAVGAPVFRQYPYAEGPLVPEGTRVALLTDDPAEAHRAPAEVAVVAPIGPALRLLAAGVPPRPGRGAGGAARLEAACATDPTDAKDAEGMHTEGTHADGLRSGAAAFGGDGRVERAGAGGPANDGARVGPPGTGRPLTPDHGDPAGPIGTGEPGGRDGASPSGLRPPQEPTGPDEAPGSPGRPGADRGTRADRDGQGPDATSERAPSVAPGPSGTPGTGGAAVPLRPAQVLAALAARMDPDTVLVEETPSSRPDLHRIVPVRRPMGFLSAAMGGLGFALPAATGVRMAAPDRPVVAVVGDGSSLYQVQALWSAARYGAGVLFIVLANGRYAVMDRLAERHGGKAPWPDFAQVSVAALARGLGCPARTAATADEVEAALDEILPGLRERTEPVVLDVAVAPDPDFRP
ncbi:thiamine pyrophosphate-binding protein [Nocardiopsis sp. RSe5-2]|uniref:Thiamine pyrophosphate-binding protein n=1 Tax=Nocardiopsis endophytica TaxID=3018445 RepID=A0ABT4UA72_9ACTN|nr:thiamine pyrophosphate-dependent enzyme [Nocardiopsis endophytica]MDA2813379.1 thiamine pyrophosphate-binding protein [Nocardiopsis endophytica]